MTVSCRKPVVVDKHHFINAICFMPFNYSKGATEPQSEHRSPSISLPSHYPLLGVKAADGVLVLDGAGRDAEAVLVAAGLVHARADPDAVRPLDAVGAGDEAGAVEREVAVLVDLEALALAVAGRGLGAGGVAELALACRDLLARNAHYPGKW